MTTSIGSVPPPSSLSYTGAVVVPCILRTFSPENTFNTFSVPTVWINTQIGNAYMLTRKPNGVAEWILIGGPNGTLDTITTPDSVVVVPFAGNINFAQIGGIDITGSGDTVRFEVTGGGLEWVEVNPTSEQMEPDTGYIINNANPVTLTLPELCDQGSILAVTGKGTGGWTIGQNAGQTIFFGTATTTTGVGGSLSSTHQRDTVYLLCVTENTEFNVLHVQGNLTYV